MAQRVQVVLEDDVDGGPADETVVFSLDGASYEVDLSSKNAAAFRDLLAPYVGVGRRTGGRRRRSGAERPASSGGRSSEAGQIREWAAENGHEVSARGRIPAEVREAYEKATTKKK